MCFMANPEETAKYRAHLAAAKYRIAYKVVVTTGLLWAPENYLGHPIIEEPSGQKSFYYEPGKTYRAHGLNNRLRDVDKLKMGRRMEAGIYVYTTSSAVREYCYSLLEIVIRVKVHAKDLIGAEGNKACFRRVQVLGIK